MPASWDPLSSRHPTAPTCDLRAGSLEAPTLRAPEFRDAADHAVRRAGAFFSADFFAVLAAGFLAADFLADFFAGAACLLAVFFVAEPDPDFFAVDFFVAPRADPASAPDSASPVPAPRLLLASATLRRSASIRSTTWPARGASTGACTSCPATLASMTSSSASR